MTDFLALAPWAFVAGVLTILAPCTLPIIPAYLGFISGVSVKDLEGPERALGARRKIFLNGLVFVLGFGAVLVLLGTLVGFAGSLLFAYRIWFARIGGIFVIIFGLFMLNVFKVPFLAREFKLETPAIFERGRTSNSFILGAAFAFGWTPCVGPVLGSILFLAGTSATAGTGALLLSIFTAGLAVPFLAIALGIGSASRLLARAAGYLTAIQIISGLFLIALGILLFTDSLALLIPYGYRLFRFINYEGLLDYL